MGRILLPGLHVGDDALAAAEDVPEPVHLLVVPIPDHALTALEYELFTKLREQVGAQMGRIQATAAAVAQLDAFAS